MTLIQDINFFSMLNSFRFFLNVFFASMCIVVLLLSCNDGIKSKDKRDAAIDYSSDSMTVSKYYDDGTKESEGVLKQGVKDGIAKTYHPNGRIKQKGLWVKDKQEGIWEFYDENGRISAKVSFKNDMQDGISIFFYETGIVSEKTTWKEGTLDGKSYQYYANGAIKRISNWEKGKMLNEQRFDSAVNVTTNKAQ